jgi:hypothetical protein
LLAEIAENPAWADLKDITPEFLHTPHYSPAFHPAEYLIHMGPAGGTPPSALHLHPKPKLD